MAQTYSNDLRAKFLQACEKRQESLRKLAERFGVSYGWAQKILSAQRRTGSTDRPVGRPRGFPSRLTPELRQKLRVRIGQSPDATLLELQAWLREQQQVSISVQRLSAVLLEMGMRRKKSLHAAEQDSESGQAKRSAWREQLAGIAAERLVFLDESGVTTDMTRTAHPRSSPRWTLANGDDAGSHQQQGLAGHNDGCRAH